MIDLRELLFARGLPKDRRIKLIRHQSSKWDIPESVARGQFELYQSNQGRPIFRCDYIVSCLGEKHSMARVFGVYAVEGVARDAGRNWPAEYLYPEMRPGLLWYKLRKLQDFADLENRVVFKWGSSPRAWHQRLGPREVVEILPPGYVREFPGFDDTLLSYAELQAIIAQPAANREWHRALGSVAGIYLITDTRDGRQYVGSAIGKDGLLGRWSGYARDGHGGNKLLRALLADDVEAARHFRFSILRAMPVTVTPNEVLASEVIHKRKLDSRAFGLNSN